MIAKDSTSALDPPSLKQHGIGNDEAADGEICVSHSPDVDGIT